MRFICARHVVCSSARTIWGTTVPPAAWLLCVRQRPLKLQRVCATVGSSMLARQMLRAASASLARCTSVVLHRPAFWMRTAGLARSGCEVPLTAGPLWTFDGEVRPATLLRLWQASAYPQNPIPSFCLISESIACALHRTKKLKIPSSYSGTL